MARPFSYRIADTPNGRFEVIVVLHPRKVFRHVGLLTLAEAVEWVEGLCELMAACGASIEERQIGPDPGRLMRRCPSSDHAE